MARSARERALGLAVTLHGVVEMPFPAGRAIDEALELATDLGDALLELARTLLHREPADTESDDLEIREECVRRRGDHVALLTIRAEIGLAVGSLARHHLVIDRFGRQVHECVIDRAVVRRDVAPDASM